MGMARKNPSYRPRLLVEDLLHKAHPKGLTPEEILRGLGEEIPPLVTGQNKGKRLKNARRRGLLQGLRQTCHRIARCYGTITRRDGRWYSAAPFTKVRVWLSYERLDVKKAKIFFLWLSYLGAVPRGPSFVSFDFDFQTQPVTELRQAIRAFSLGPKAKVYCLVQRGESQPVLAGWLLGSGKRSGNQATSFSEGFGLAEKTTGTGAPSIPITWKGETRAASDWARRLGISASAISRRRKRGLPTAEVLRPAPR